MRTVQMTFDDKLIASVDKAVKSLKTTRSAFARNALRDALNRLNLRQLEDRHKKGYLSHPAKKNEFSAWEDEQAWGDE
jgi:metal-responsive CopG/Arc/MetJ family transcriptional regulator